MQIAMRTLLALAALLAFSCADRRDKAACEQLVDHVIKISQTPVPRRDLITRCVNDLSREEFACASAATSKADLEKCAGW